ncbi:MAG: FHA domain-containing protein [Acidimicrobiales bacterium]
MTATCPAGHESTTDDYCDTCGMPIAAAPSAVPTSPPTDPASPQPPEAAAEAAPADTPCPGCGDNVVGRFCESCGYDLESGQAPQPATVTLSLSADRSHWARMVGSGEPAFPPAAPALTFELSGDQVTLGRVRGGAEPDVDLALTGAAADPGVSHHQCEFERQEGATAWIVRDSGSSNGTWINDADEPLADGQTHTLAEGDRIFVGAWTCLTVHFAAPPAPAP